LERRQFIKQLTGASNQSILKWTVLLVLLFVLAKVDFTKLSYDLWSLSKFAGIVLLFVAASFSAVLLAVFLCRKLIQLLPIQLAGWFKKHGQKPDILLYCLLVGVIACYPVVRNNDNFLIVMACSYLFSFFKKRYERGDESIRQNEFTK
jgi:hypothetical protein